MTTGNDIFKIESLEHTGGEIKAALTINPDSDIFKGHFPGQPVVPGACMLQIVKDVLEQALNMALILKKADNLKFINMIEPGSVSAVQLNIVYKIVGELVWLSAKISTGDVIYFKFQGSYGVVADYRHTGS